MFIDQVRVHLRGGDGGAGIVAFIRSRGRPRGKPVGGSGGPGGDVVVEADSAVSTLLDYVRRPHRKAGSGTHGRGGLQHGSRGEDLVLRVPPGTVIRDEAGTILADLALPGQRATLVQGGRGGQGNAALAGPRRISPDYAEQGEYGPEADFVFELKLLADAALIGFPNAGKSTLISRVSAAKPKIADYPFTTLTPHLGVVEVDGRRFVLADIPGLIEGAAEGRGLGHEFLRHAERSRVLVFLLDPSPTQDFDCPAQLGVLASEMERHSSDLAGRPRLVVVGKADLPGADEQAARIQAAGTEVHLVSGVTGVGVERLMHAIADLADSAPRTPEGEGYVLHRPMAPGFSVEREDEQWVVSGRAAERAVAFDDLTKPGAAALAARRLAAAGIEEELRRRGAVAGDEVRIGDHVFEFTQDSDDEEE